MNGGILHSAAAMDLLGRIQEARAQNLANADTAGYRKRISSAEAFAAALRQAGGLALPAYQGRIDFRPGDLRPTGGELDVAVEGKGFFSLETQEGVRFTRNGNFNLDGQGFLTAADGARVLGENGPIQADPLRGPLAFAENGDVLQANELLGRLRIVEFADPARLQPDGDGRFVEGAGADPTDSVESRVHQGYLEGSNVNVVDELVQMISGFRAFESAHKALVGIDRIRGEAINSHR